MSNEKVIRLPSNANSPGSHENTVAHYITELKQAFDEPGNWVVGVSEVSYTKSWSEVLHKDELVLIIPAVEDPTYLGYRLPNDANGWQEAELMPAAQALSSSQANVPFLVENLTMEMTHENTDMNQSNETDSEHDDNEDEDRSSGTDPNPTLNRAENQSLSNSSALPVVQQRTEAGALNPGNDVNGTDQQRPGARDEPAAVEEVVNGNADAERVPGSQTVAKPSDHEQYTNQAIVFKPTVTWPNVNAEKAGEFFLCLGQLANYRGTEQGISFLEQELLSVFNEIYLTAFPEIDSNTLNQDYQKLVTVARDVRNVVMKQTSQVDFATPRGFIFSQSGVLSTTLEQFLNDILKADKVMQDMAQSTIRYLSGLTKHKSTWSNRLAELYDQLPELSVKSSEKNLVIMRFNSFVELYKVRFGEALTAQDKRTTGQGLKTYILSNLQFFCPVTQQVFMSIANEYIATTGNRKRRAVTVETPAKPNYIDPRTLLSSEEIALSTVKAQEYTLGELIKSINTCLSYATDRAQRKMLDYVLASRNQPKNSMRLPKQRYPPRVKYNSTTDKLSIEAGVLVNMLHSSSFEDNGHRYGLKIYPTFSRELATQLGFAIREELSFGFAAIKDAVPVSRPGYYSLFLYSNIVKHTPLGDTESQLLRLVQIPNKAKYGEQVTIIYDKPQFYPLSHNYFKQIEIKFLDDTGHKIPFLFGRSFVTLVLKRIDD